ncbi:MAG: large conductance mechanosensitive channel protein MscL [Anaerolineaceae bacterium]
MSIVKEFKEFILKGNVLDLAFGVVIGGAFGAVVNSLVKDIIMPPIGLLLGGVNFSDLYIRLNETARALPAGTPLAAAQESGAVVMAYGNWLMTIINFIIIAFCIFLLIKAINNMKRKPAEAPVAPTTKICPFCKTEIPLEATRCPHCTSQLG